jgi:hypothetical protein
MNEGWMDDNLETMYSPIIRGSPAHHSIAAYDPTFI